SQRAQLRPESMNTPPTISTIRERCTYQCEGTSATRCATVVWLFGTKPEIRARLPITINNQLMIVIESGRLFIGPCIEPQFYQQPQPRSPAGGIVIKFWSAVTCDRFGLRPGDRWFAHKAPTSRRTPNTTRPGDN